MPDYRLARPRINGSATLVWYIVWAEGRRSRRFSTKTTDKVEAKRVLARFVAAEAAPPESFTCADLSKAYLAERREAGVKYPKALENCLRHTDAHFGPLPPSMVSRATVRMYVSNRRGAGVKDSTITKELCIFRQALKFGVKEKWMDEEPKVETPGGGHARQRFLSRVEFATIFFAASPLHLRVFLGLAIDTLARGKAVLALTWDRVDFDRRIIWYAQHDPGSKKRAVQVPMSDRLATLLATAKECALSDHVIEWNGRPVKSIRKAYERACRLAGVPDAHRHDLRRSGASWAVQGGMSFDAVAALLGDSVEITKRHYAMFSPGYLREVVESIESGTGGRRA